MLAQRPADDGVKRCGADYVFKTLGEAAELILSRPPVKRRSRAPKARRTSDQAGAKGERGDAASLPTEAAGEIVDRLDAMLDLMRQQRRTTMYRDFSAAKLLGAVCQMIALGLLLWSWVAMTENQTEAAVSRGLSTIAVQLLALTLFVLHRRD